MKVATWGYKVNDNGKVVPSKFDKEIDKSIIAKVTEQLTKQDELSF